MACTYTYGLCVRVDIRCGVRHMESTLGAETTRSGEGVSRPPCPCAPICGTAGTWLARREQVWTGDTYLIPLVLLPSCFGDDGRHGRVRLMTDRRKRRGCAFCQWGGRGWERGHEERLAPRLYSCSGLLFWWPSLFSPAPIACITCTCYSRERTLYITVGARYICAIPRNKYAVREHVASR